MASSAFSLATRCFVLVIVTGTIALRCDAAENPQTLQPKLRGAEALMAEWPALSPDPAEPAQNSSQSTGSHHFDSELTAYRRTAATLSVIDAAQGWLNLVDTYFRRASPASSYLLKEREVLPNFSAVLAGLPPVSAWPQLAQAIKQRPLDPKSVKVTDFTLKLLGARLANDRAEEIEIQNQLRAFLKKRRTQKLLHVFEDGLQRQNEDPAAALEIFIRAIEASASTPSDRGEVDFSSVTSPDLVRLLGVEKAKSLVVKALLSPIPQINFDKGKSTRQLAESCAVEHIEQMTVPRWYLANRLGSPVLFEALEKRFGTPTEKPSRGPLLTLHSEEESASSHFSEYQEAYGHHILNLLIAGRQAEAVKRALATQAPRRESLLQSGAEVLADRGHAEEVAEFLHGVLTQRPELPWWETYVQIAARAGQSSEALAALKAAIAAPQLSPSQKQTLSTFLADALLADDQVDAGGAELQRTLATTSSGNQAEEGPRDLQIKTATKLLKLGTALDQGPWIDSAASCLVASAVAEKSYWATESIAQDLLDAKRYREAETVLAAAMKTVLQNRGSQYAPHSSSNSISILTSLAHLYQANGYNTDVFALLDRAPSWGALDLMQIEGYSDRPTLFCTVASALIETGAPERATPLLLDVMERTRGRDESYQLWFKTAPVDVEKQLDALAADDPFEERPLIWKAEYLRRAGRLEEAEKACRAAIAIDPSDGEQPAGDRLRVYAVLAEIREARGDAEQAKIYRQVVRAIRLAEKADRLFHAGLLKRAIALYHEALSLFSDAYCIQSRLAIRLAEAGRTQEAEEHYRRAYELMPDSFGRVESHCFGCEHAFGPEKAQTIAERVFTQFIEKNPNKPQVHYLLGYLRSEQDRPQEAFTHYREATRLDPDYLNAWKKISELGDDALLSEADFDLSVQNILRLDPRGKHVTPPVEKVRDLKILFRHADSQKRGVALRNSVYPLKASAAFAAKASDEELTHTSESNQRLTREYLVAGHPFLQSMTSLLEYSTYDSGEDR